jgi:hypothetical protein
MLVPGCPDAHACCCACARVLLRHCACTEEHVHGSHPTAPEREGARVYLVLTRLHATLWEGTPGGVGAPARSGTLHGRACVGGTHPAACEREKRAYIGLTRLHTAPWGDAPCGAGTGALHACMHFDQGGSAVWALTARYMHVRLLELAHMIEIGSVGWVRARKSEHVGSNTCCNLRLKQGETFERYACNNMYSHGNICNI